MSAFNMYTHVCHAKKKEMRPIAIDQWQTDKFFFLFYKEKVRNKKWQWLFAA